MSELEARPCLLELASCDACGSHLLSPACVRTAVSDPGAHSFPLVARSSFSHEDEANDSFSQSCSQITLVHPFIRYFEQPLCQ